MAKTDQDALRAVRHALDVIHGLVSATMDTETVSVAIEPPSAARRLESQIELYEASQLATHPPHTPPGGYM